MAPHRVARLRLLALCIAVAARTAAYAAITVLCISLLQNGNFASYRPGTLVAWLGLSAVPALLLSPFIGPLAGSRWNRAVLIGGAALVVVALFWAKTEPSVPWLSVLGLLSLEMAFFGTAVGAITTDISGAIRIGATTVRFALILFAAAGLWLFTVSHFAMSVTTPSLALGLALVGLVAILFARFPRADPTSLGQGIVKPFVAGVRDALPNRRARHAIVGLWLWFFVALAAVTALMRFGFLEDQPDDPGIDRATRHFGMAVLVGIAITGLNRHPYRHAGFVLYSAAAIVGSIFCLRFWASGMGPLVGLGFALGLSASPLLSFFLAWTSPKHHGVASALVVAGWCAGALILSAILVNLSDHAASARTPLLNILVVVTGLAFVAAFGSFFRPAMELAAETLLWPIYRVRAVGPGVDRLPPRGPYVVIGNHSSWFDPLFFATFLPTPTVPMMTSKFYDLPVLAWIMRNVIGTIRVPDKAVRHEAPELKEAVTALDRGECVVLFPEGFLRRKEAVQLRRFGRGVWQILRDRPQTPVFACWIEGAWGSYLSHRGGPPMKGKRIDFWRRIRIGVIGPLAVDPITLKDHMATRTFLMRQVSEARRPLGLEPLPVPSVHDEEGETV
jgi:1-acyl-sn-glycerol-3-phosphate acyltransferase